MMYTLAAEQPRYLNTNLPDHDTSIFLKSAVLSMCDAAYDLATLATTFAHCDFQIRSL